MTAELLSNLALLKISGSDADDFLQGQLTNDINELSAEDKSIGSWQLSGYCNPKGRLLALFHLWQENGNFYAILDNSLVETIVNRLNMFVMRSDVSIEHIKSAILLGAFSKQEVTTLGLDDLMLGNLVSGQVTNNNNVSILSIQKRYLIVLKTDSEDSNKNYHTGPDWSAAEIKDGLPQITAKTSELFIPQMINLDLLGGINFKKGCYTGQEIVARMHYLGNLKQRLFICDLTSDEPNQLQAGDKIYADEELNKSVGTLVSIDKKNKTVLAVLRLDCIKNELILNANTKLVAIKKQLVEA